MSLRLVSNVISYTTLLWQENNVLLSLRRLPTTKNRSHSLDMIGATARERKVSLSTSLAVCFTIPTTDLHVARWHLPFAIRL